MLNNITDNQQTKKQNRFYLIIMVPILLAILLSGCVFESNQQKLSKFLETSENYSTKTLPSGATYMSANIQQDKNKYYTVLDIDPNYNKSQYAWYALPHDMQKADARYCAEIAIDYAKNNDWNKDYYLYVVFFGMGQTSFVYNYETDELFYPKDIDIFKQMYDKFGTMYPKDLIGNKDGEEFLLNNGMGEIKHNEVDVTYIGIPYNVYIDDGVFKEYGREDSNVF